jgi:hypothetical protein
MAISGLRGWRAIVKAIRFTGKEFVSTHSYWIRHFDSWRNSESRPFAT